MFYEVGISISFFLAFLMLSKKKKTLADKILFAWLIIIGLHLCLFIARARALSPNFSFLLGFELPFPLFHGPFIYLYTAAATNQLPQNKKLAFLHFLTPVLSLLMFFDFFFLTPQQKIMVYQAKGVDYEKRLLVNLITTYASGIIYVIWSSLLLIRHKKNIQQQFSDTENINLNWLRYIIYGIGVVWIAVLMGKDNLIFGTAVLFVLFLGFFGLKQVGIFTSDETKISMLQADEIIAEENNSTAGLTITPESVFTDTSSPTITSVKKKYQKSGLYAEQAENIHYRLMKLMKDEKIYTEPELTLSGLAGRLAVHPNHLSQVINEKEEKNFFDYINSLRIEEFKRLVSLPENKKYTILSLAYECGFNSKSSFNRYFKKVTGLSPSEHLKD